MDGTEKLKTLIGVTYVWHLLRCMSENAEHVCVTDVSTIHPDDDADDDDECKGCRCHRHVTPTPL